MPIKPVPDIIISRLPLYLRTLISLAQTGQLTTSSQELGALMDISPAQIRKDLSQFGGFGKQGTGYRIPNLIQHLRHILHLERRWDMVLVGAGDLGHAIARYQGFDERGFQLRMVFDNDPAKIGSQVGSFIIQSTEGIVEKIRAAQIKIAMITVPQSEAQSVTDLLVEAGIVAILNYAPVMLEVPENVQVQYIDPVLHLQRMTYYLE